MSSDDTSSDRMSVELLQQSIRVATTDELSAWAESPVGGFDLGAQTVRDSVFGKLGLPVIHNQRVLLGSRIVDAERIEPKDGGRVVVIDLTPLGWTANRAEAAVLGEFLGERDSTVDDVLLAELATRLATEEAELFLSTGMDGDDLDALIEQIEADQHNVGLADIEDPDNVPELPTVEPVTKPGDVWLLGPHRLIAGDCTDPATVKTVMDGHTAEMIHADPPYGMGKENEGIANDNLYGPKLDAFQMEWWNACRPHVQDNGSAYIWGNPEDLWRLWYQGGLSASERLTFRSDVVWSKGSSGAGGMSLIGSDGLRQFPPSTERCLFFMFGAQEQSTNADEYWEGWEPIRAYLDGERERLGWGVEDAKIAAGHSPTSGCHWFTASQWAMPTEAVYKAWQAATQGDAFKREYDDIKREYDDIHAEWLATRAPFDNTHDNMTDVWEFPRVTGEDRHGHATPKPVDMVGRAIKSSSTPGGHVLVPFAGTLPEVIACEQSGRICHAIELSPAYVDVICERYERATGVKPILESSGEPHSFVGGT